MGWPRDEHDDEDFATPPVVSRKTSDDYRLELAKLESEKKLIEGLKSEKAEILKVKDHNQKLTYKLDDLRKEVDTLKDIEDSAEKHRKDLKIEYELQKKKIENMGLEKKELEARLQNLKLNHKEELNKLKREYGTAANGLREDIRELQKGYGKKNK